MKNNKRKVTLYRLKRGKEADELYHKKMASYDGNRERANEKIYNETVIEIGKKYYGSTSALCSSNADDDWKLYHRRKDIYKKTIGDLREYYKQRFSVLENKPDPSEICKAIISEHRLVFDGHYADFFAGQTKKQYYDAICVRYHRYRPDLSLKDFKKLVSYTTKNLDNSTETRRKLTEMSAKEELEKSMSALSDAEFGILLAKNSPTKPQPGLLF